ncbi:EAL domain-containing protein [Actinotalea sp. M2MS4P-6]|uniref:putative bifunctional diguanylate cyclase/phosphodiesterase n=1 Tax=Actinotalea sp. M2MS4P-6 TaxID=2983762 RepID=UPI0021E44257|nr:EAL domain-containing protein [Actinotalea sp. M2MS4P-6]MCV2393091.1 EAL domain-containing protein [Actinotalea sp. M2MS4P-6]
MIVRWSWAGFLAIGVALTAVAVALPGTVVADVAWLTGGLLSVGALVAGPLLHRPVSPWVWHSLAGGLLCWVLSGGARALLPADAAAATWASGVLDLTAIALLCAGLLGFSQRHTPDHVLPTLDAAIVTLAASMMMWIFVALPAWRAEAGADRWFDALRPFGFALLFGVFYRLSYTAGRGRVAARGVTILIGSIITLQSVAHATGLAALDNRPTTTGAHWIVSLVLAGTIALHPDMRGLTEPTPPRRERPHWIQVVALTGALVLGPGTIASQALLGQTFPLPVAVAMYMGLVALVSARMIVMLHRVTGQATTDELTGLPNRRALQRLAPLRLADGERHALLLLDLDRFKEVNDSLGHHAGDTLLAEVAGRLRDRLRSGDLLARLGGDEFAALLEDAGREEAARVAAALVAALEDPFVLDEMTVHSAVSIGVALYPDDGADLSTLLRKADIAMYRAKGAGDRVAHAGENRGVDRLRLSEEFRAALEDDQLVLHYQPKIDLVTGQVSGVEALVRWQHPEHGLLYPDAFLPRVEEAGLMRAMTRVVLGIALDQAVDWRAEGRTLSVAVNLSASSLTDSELPGEIAAMLAERALPPHALGLEITEEFLMTDRARARTVLTALRDHGVRISVDDFGTGYSSLSYLRDLPIDELKLDRSFVFPMSDDPRAAALVGSTVTLAHSLGLHMVAEGVEDGRAYDELFRLGCDTAQGYWMSRPLPAVELAQWLDRAEVPAEAAAEPVED